MAYAWNHFLYIPLLNALIYLYENFAGNNFGWAVVELTVLLRVALLPLTIIAERNTAKYERLQARIDHMHREAAGDSVAKKSKIRALLVKEGVSPWAKVASFGLQALVFVLLYQVFIGGMNYGKLSVLYSWVRYPDYINLNFFGFNVALHNIWWAAAVGVLLFLEITVSYRHNKNIATSDQLYRILFPAMTAAVLFALPMVKSIFILTSMLFGLLISLIRHAAFPVKPEPLAAQEA